MEIHDGFIVSVFSYCDRWCETCALTSHCRVFADVARADAAREGQVAAIIHASPIPQEPAPAPPRWLEDVLEQMNSLAGCPLTNDELARWTPRMATAHREIYERAKVYCTWAHDRIAPGEPKNRAAGIDPAAVVLWFSSLIASTVRRALTGLAEFDGNREVPPDHEGAAKVALVGIDRSDAAWQQLAAEQRISVARATLYREELVWIRARLEAAIPGARAFVRPGFDEPAAVAAIDGSTAHG